MAGTTLPRKVTTGLHQADNMADNPLISNTTARRNLNIAKTTGTMIALRIKDPNRDSTNNKITALNHSTSGRITKRNITSVTITSPKNLALLTTRDTNSNTSSLLTTSQVSPRVMIKAISSIRITRRTMGTVEIRATGAIRADIGRMRDTGRITGTDKIKATRVIRGIRAVRGMDRIHAIEADLDMSRKGF